MNHSRSNELKFAENVQFNSTYNSFIGTVHILRNQFLAGV